MTIRSSYDETRGAEAGRSRRPRAQVLVLAAALAVALAPAAFARNDDSDSDSDNEEAFCSATAVHQYHACRNEVRDDVSTGKAICIQVADDDERRECFGEVRQALREGDQLCREQRTARRKLCGLIGEGRYVPDFDPANYDDDFRNITTPNPYFPVTIGNVWTYQSDGESNTISVLDQTKLIEGVTCIVFHDLASKDDNSGENTNDWYAQHEDGSLAYCGEEVENLELFPGDMPQALERVNINGSFKAGRDGDLPGTIFPPAPPVVGTSYRQEFSAGNAEDAATIIANDYGYGVDSDLDEFAPRELVELLCAAHDCVVTAEISPIEPDVLDHKYYAPDIGLFLEVKPRDGEINQLVECNFDPRCALLPVP